MNEPGNNNLLRSRPRRSSVLNNNARLVDHVLCYVRAIEMNHPSVIIQRVRLKLCDSASPTLRTGGWRLKAVLLVAGERMRAAARRASSSALLRASASAAALACACAWGCVVSCQLCRDSKICECRAVPNLENACWSTRKVTMDEQNSTHSSQCWNPMPLC